MDPPISPFEVETIRKLDRECRTYYNELKDPPKPSLTDSLRSLAENQAAQDKLDKIKAKKKSKNG